MTSPKNSSHTHSPLPTGNGCSATQIVPALSTGPSAAHKITQFSRQAHWLSPRSNAPYSPLLKFILRRVPFAQRLYRLYLYLTKEIQFLGYRLTPLGAWLRKRWAAQATAYIKANAPARYAGFLVPGSEIGCKRRVNDTEYLAALHREGVELVWEDAVVEVVEEGVRTRSGRVVRADAVVLANGFQTRRMLWPMEIVGRGGVGLEEHVSGLHHHLPFIHTCTGWHDMKLTLPHSGTK